MPRAKQRCSKLKCPNYKPCPKHNGWRNASATRPYPPNWKSLKKQARNFASKICYLCGRRDPNGQVDHITPRAEGGSDDPSNLAWICCDCHDAKTDAERARGVARRREGRGR